MNCNLAFMFSNWYSGATLLAILLNNHSNVVCNGETFPFQYDESNKDVYICSCGQHMRQCSFYSSVSQPLKLESGSWSNDFRIMPNVAGNAFINRMVGSFNRYVWLRNLMLIPGSPFRLRLNRYLSTHLEFYANARRYSGSDCYIDGTKSIRRTELFFQYATSNIKIVYLVRDGRGFCRSYMKNRGLAGEQLDRAADAWLEYIRLVDIFSKRYPSVDILTVRYEDLCNHLPETLAKVCGFLNLSYEEKMVGGPREHHMLGNRMRSSFDGTIKEDLSWREKFTQGEIQRLNERMRPELERYGYL